MKRGIAIVVLFLAASATACGDNDTSGVSGESEPSVTDGVTEEPTDDEDGPRVVLHDAGAEPRAELRYDVTEGESEHATMTMTMGMDVTLNGDRQQGVPAMPMAVGTQVDITDVADNGNITATFAYDEVGVVGKGAAAEQMEAALGQIVGVEGTLRTTSSGGVIDSELHVPDRVDPMLRSMLDSFESQVENMVPPLPEEAVGVGANWTVHSASTLNSIELEAAYDYTIVELDADSVVLDVSYVQTADPQDVEAPGLPAGTTLHLESMDTSGSGRVTIDLGRLLPLAQEMEGGGTIRMTAEADGEEMAMLQELDITMEVRPD